MWTATTHKQHSWADSGHNHERVNRSHEHHRQNRQETAPSSRLRRPVKALDGRTLFRLDQQNRRLAKDFEATIQSTAAFFYAASDMLLVRRLARDS
jgi:hypothetical protein